MPADCNADRDLTVMFGNPVVTLTEIRLCPVFRNNPAIPECQKADEKTGVGRYSSCYFVKTLFFCLTKPFFDISFLYNL